MNKLSNKIITLFLIFMIGAGVGGFIVERNLPKPKAEIIEVKEKRLVGDVWGHKEIPETWILLTEIHPAKDDYHTGYEYESLKKGDDCGYIEEWQFGFIGLDLIYRKK